MEEIKKGIVLKIPFVIIMGFIMFIPIFVKAFDSKMPVLGSLYEVNKKGSYNISESTLNNDIYEKGTALGCFAIIGDLEQLQDDEHKSYIIYSGNASFNYSINQNYFNKSKTSRYVCNEKENTVEGKELGSKIGKGAIIIQASFDNASWVTQKTITDVGGNNHNIDECIYQTADTQIENGCYYRILVVYKTRKKDGLKYDYKKYIEEYKFYIQKYKEKQTQKEEEEPVAVSSENRKELGSVEKKKKNTGYDKTQTLDVKDPHYGWSLGAFVISGFTAEAPDGNGQYPTFLKITNEGQDDTVKLRFKLKKDINRLNGDPKLFVVEDKKGYDQYFQVPKQNFGRGTLIIRKTDVDGTVNKPIVYTNYLSGVSSVDANTEIDVNEEGDYEVALDYKIKKKNGLATATYDYRIFIKFSVRNGNCMFFPRDLSTDIRATLSDGAIAPSGFELDLAESKDLELNIKKYDLDGDEDLLFNKPALDGNQYTEEGKYIISARNKYTGEKVEKTIYVGEKSKIESILEQEKKTVDIESGKEDIQDANNSTQEGDEKESNTENNLEEDEVKEEKIKENSSEVNIEENSETDSELASKDEEKN